MQKKGSVSIPKTVDEYLKRLAPDQRKALQDVRQVILTTVPDAEEVISYQMPGYRYKGQLVFFAAFTNHCSLFGTSKQLLKTFEKELAPFHTSGTTIHFTPDKPLPGSLVKKIVTLRKKQNEERFELKMAEKARKKNSTILKK
jgi:uncharacterized protein YdhG (YjbR/CyaY superfamily)